MKRFMNKKVAAIGLAAGLALGAAGAAFAYYTSNGSGTGNVTAGSANSVTLAVTNVTLNGPGGAAVPIPYTFTNTAGNGAQTFGTVSAVVNSISAGANGCTLALADLSTTTSTGSIGQVADGAPYSSNTGTEPTISMGNLPTTDQSACEGQTISVTLTAAQGS